MTPDQSPGHVPFASMEHSAPGSVIAGLIEQVPERGIIRINGGTLDPKVFDKQVATALRTAVKEKAAQVKVASGPIAVVDRRGENPLL